MSSRPAVVVAGLIALTLGAAGARGADGPDPREVNRAIDLGVDFLKRQQRADDGSWQYQSNHVVGMSALAGLALLESGVDRDDPAIRKVERGIRASVVDEPQTYDLTLAILFLSRVQPEIPGPNDDVIRRIARRLAGGG
ncbi:MAG TPA: hypothetical protein VF590_09840, partial [Isosphaeraceae bacterium]